MTDTPDAPSTNPAPELRPELRPEIHRWCEAWKTCLQNVLSQILGSASGKTGAFEISLQSVPITDSDVWYTVVAGGTARGEMTLRLPAASGIALARMFLGEAETAPEGTAAEPIDAIQISAEQKEALEELLRQIAGLAATALAPIVGGEVQFHLSASAAPSWSSDAIACLQNRNEDEGEADTSITVEIRISPALAAALQPQPTPQTSVPGAPPLAPLSSAGSSTESSSETAPSASYRRLMDVDLDVKLRFGTRRMQLRDVLALSAGVVVELDNSLHSPVDLLLDGRLIAQGEVVIVDGKYGLRVTDVIEPPPAAASPV
jgi:flagellar motor switch protein FliN